MKYYVPTDVWNLIRKVNWDGKWWIKEEGKISTGNILCLVIWWITSTNTKPENGKKNKKQKQQQHCGEVVTLVAADLQQSQWEKTLADR